jgi:hypothetical protein
MNTSLKRIVIVHRSDGNSRINQPAIAHARALIWMGERVDDNAESLISSLLSAVRRINGVDRPGASAKIVTRRKGRDSFGRETSIAEGIKVDCLNNETK